MCVWGEVNSEKQQTINHKVELTREGGFASFHVDAKGVLKRLLQIPLEKSPWRMSAMPRLSTASFSHMGHPALTYTKEHIESMDDFHSQWETIKTMDLAKQPARRIYHLQYPFLCLNKYWRD